MLITAPHHPITARQRRTLVSELVASGVSKPSEVRVALAQRGIGNRHGRPWSDSTIRNDIRIAQQVQTVTEMIGRTVDVEPVWQWKYSKSYDATQTDYEFWDELRRGKADGFAFGGLFCMPLTQIVAGTAVGPGFEISLADTVEASQENIDYTNEMLARMVSHQHRALLQMVTDLYGLGDQYVIVNPDGSFSYASPELVKITPSPLDYRTIDAMTVTTKLDMYTITDVYTPTERTLTVKRGGQVTYAQTFPNLIGAIPVAHFPNDRGTNELYGRPIYEALYRLFSRYDDIVEKSIDGVELMGNPMPVFEGMENIQDTIDANTTATDETYTDDDGNSVDRQLLKWDRLGALFVGKGGRFHFASPGQFTNDARNMLKSLFLLMLDYTRVPEAVWGGAINSSRASADAQMPPFYQYIEARRVMLEGDGADPELGQEPANGLYALFDIWLKMRALTDPRIVVGPLTITWPELSRENWETMLKWTQYLRNTSILDDATTLQLFGQVDDPAAVLERAREEADERRQMAEDMFQRELTQAQANEPGDEDQDDTAQDEDQAAGPTEPVRA